MKVKKSITDVVSLSLLLLVILSSYVFLSSWTSSFVSEKYSSTSTSFDARFFGINDDLELVIDFGKGGQDVEYVKASGYNCNISGTYVGFNEINLSSCIHTFGGKNVVNIVIKTNTNFYDKNFYVDGDNNVCDYLNGGNWVFVPGNPVLNTTDFCVMKYEAKWDGSGTINNPINMYCGNGNDGGGNDCPTDGSVGVESKPEYKSLSNIYQWEARLLCENIGDSYSLISDNQWVTIARNMEIVPENWFGGVVYQNFMFSGHNDDGNDGGSYNGVVLNATYDDTDGFYRTGDSFTGCDSSYDDFQASDDTITGRACAGQRRTLYTSHGQVIWDMAGNSLEITNDSYSLAYADLGKSSTILAIEMDNITGYSQIKPINTSLNSSNGIGAVYNNVGDPNPSSDVLYVSMRGGIFLTGYRAGIYSNRYFNGPNFAGTVIGFRCTYTIPT